MHLSSRLSLTIVTDMSLNFVSQHGAWQQRLKTEFLGSEKAERARLRPRLIAASNPNNMRDVPFHHTLQPHCAVRLAMHRSSAQPCNTTFTGSFNSTADCSRLQETRGKYSGNTLYRSGSVGHLRTKETQTTDTPVLKTRPKSRIRPVSAQALKLYAGLLQRMLGKEKAV